MNKLPNYAIILILVGALLAGFFLGSHMRAGHRGMSKHKGRGHMSKSHKKGHFSQKLGLTEDQQKKLGALRSVEKKDMIKDYSERRKKHEDMMKKVLTPEQMKKIEEMRKSHSKRRK